MDSPRRQRAYAEIEQQISHLRGEIRALETKKNTLALISQVPTEILGRIFQFVQSEICAAAEPPLDPNADTDKDSDEDEDDEDDDEDSDPDVGPRKKRRGPVLDWIKISHVCRHWREVAINHTSLWTKPPITNWNWTLEMLNRSRTAPLHIMLDATLVEDDDDMIMTLTSHMSHVAVLNMWKASPEFIQDFFEELPDSMPLLEEIAINVYLLDSHALDEATDLPTNFTVTGQQMVLPDSICRRAPNLRRVRLMRININWDLPTLPPLTSLELYFLSKAPTLPQLRSALEQMPNIETLLLKSALPTPTGSSTTPQQPITLPKLRKISLAGGPEQMDTFYANFVTPNANEVQCSYIYEQGAYDLPHILSTIQHPYSLPARGPRMVQFLYHRLIISQIAFAEDVGEMPGLSVKIIAMEQMTQQADEEATDMLMMQLFMAVDWSRLDTISLSKADVSTDMLCETFGDVSSLRQIIVGSGAAHAFIETLAMHTDVDPKSDAYCLFFKGLKEVWFDDVTFDGGIWSVDGEVKVEDFLDCLIARCNRGVPIERLQLRRCALLEEEDVKSFKEVVPDVDWDHFENEVDEATMEMALRQVLLGNINL